MVRETRCHILTFCFFLNYIFSINLLSLKYWEFEIVKVLISKICYWILSKWSYQLTIYGLFYLGTCVMLSLILLLMWEATRKIVNLLPDYNQVPLSPADVYHRWGPRHNTWQDAPASLSPQKSLPTLTSKWLSIDVIFPLCRVNKYHHIWSYHKMYFKFQQTVTGLKIKDEVNHLSFLKINYKINILRWM